MFFWQTASLKFREFRVNTPILINTTKGTKNSLIKLRKEASICPTDAVYSKNLRISKNLMKIEVERNTVTQSKRETTAV
jgi:hypothetical protein